MIYNVNNELFHFMDTRDMGWTLSLLYFLQKEYKLQRDKKNRITFYPDVEFTPDKKEMSEIEFVLRLTDKEGDDELLYTVYVYKSMMYWAEVRICKEGVKEFFGYYPREIYLSKPKGEERDGLQHE